MFGGVEVADAIGEGSRATVGCSRGAGPVMTGGADHGRGFRGTTVTIIG